MINAICQNNLFEKKIMYFIRNRSIYVTASESWTKNKLRWIKS
jgi:hypothetical protein